MDWGSVIGGGLSAVGSIAGGLFGSKGGGHSAQYYADIAYNNQKRIAENQPSWMVEGAKKAGLHPLAVLGMPLAQGQGQFVGDTGYQDKDYSWLSDAGQGIGRAAGALLSKEDRVKQQQYDEARMGLQLENSKLQNEYLHAQIDQTKQDMAMQLARSAERSLIRTGQNPGFQIGVDGRTTRQVIDGQNDAIGSNLFKVKPAEIIASDPQRYAAEAGSVPEIRFSRTTDGGYAPMRSQALEEALEDDFLGSLGWNLRNRLAANLYDRADSAPPDKFLPGRGYTWVFNIPKQAWYPMKKDAPWYEYPRKKYWPD